MPDGRRLPDDEYQNQDDEQERGIGDDEEEEFDDTDDLDEEDEEDEDLDPPRGIGEDRGFSSEIGSEGGSQGDMEVERRSRVMRGSEATTTAMTDQDRGFHDRHAGGGVPRSRR